MDYRHYGYDVSDIPAPSDDREVNKVINGLIAKSAPANKKELRKMIYAELNEYIKKNPDFKTYSRKYGKDPVLDLNYIDVSNIKDFSDLFAGEEFKVLRDRFNLKLFKWDVSNAQNMSKMFYDMGTFNAPLNAWGKKLKNVRDMSYMFACATEFDQNISSWDVSNVTNMMGMFKESAFNHSIENWDVSKVTNMSEMFKDNYSFNMPLDKWKGKLGNVRYADEMFCQTEYKLSLACLMFDETICSTENIIAFCPVAKMNRTNWPYPVNNSFSENADDDDPDWLTTTIFGY